MAKAPKPSTPAYEVTSGVLHKDHWIGDHVVLTVTPSDEPRTIRITVWNPFYNRDYLNNEVEVKLDGRSVFAERMQPSRAATVDYVLASDEELEVEVRTAARLVADPLDPRERGVIVKLVEEPVKA
jgi:hypothetical protein